MNYEEQIMKIPSDANFLKNKDISDILFAYLYLVSYPDENGKMKLNRYKFNGAKFFDMDKRTYYKKLAALEDNKHIKIENQMIEVKCNRLKNYCWIPRSTLEVLVGSKIPNIIKVYISLMIFYENHTDSWFTCKSLLEQIGYSGMKQSSNNKKIKEMLKYLQDYDLIDFKVEHCKEYNCFRYKILKVNKGVKKHEKNILDT